MESHLGAKELGLARRALLAWFRAHMRPLPWRRDYEAYGVWISEIMLQQTQMERGVERYLAWMRRFPTLADLASASEEEVLKAWEGLGYYSRARNLLRAARLVMERWGGAFPSSAEEIGSLPGVGPYTAAAVASIAFGRDVACVDANVERVVSRLFDLDLDLRREPGRSRLRDLAETLLARGEAREHNQAMMELGALVCGKRPRCGACPLADFCLARRRGTEGLRPVLPRREARIPLSTAAGLFAQKGRVLVARALPGEIWEGLWLFPGGAVEEGASPAEACERRVLELAGVAARAGRRLALLRHGYTRYSVSLHLFPLEPDRERRGRAPDPRAELRWASLEELRSLPMPSVHARIAASLSFRRGTLLCSLARPSLLEGD